MTESIPTPVPTVPPIDFKKIINDQVYPDSGLSETQQQEFVGRYSFSALILQFVYYFAMDDQLMAWLSLVCSVSIILIPALFIFPLFARRRAFHKRSWSGFNEFYHNQKNWDREALYLTIATIFLGLVALWIIGPMILGSARNLTGPAPGSSDFTQQLQDTVRQYQEILN